MSRLLAALLILPLLLLSLPAAPAWADGNGQEDLDRATELKISIADPRDLDGLTRVVDLLDASIEKGLDEANAEFAEQMLISALLERGSARAEAILGRPIADPRRDPRWVQTRQMALTDLQRAVGLDETLYGAHFLIGRLQSLPLGDPGAARRALSKVIQAPADSVEPEQLAQAYALRGATQTEAEKQAEDYAKAIELAPDKAEYYLLQAQSHVRADDYEAALEATEKAAEIAPGNAAVYELRGHIYRAMEKPEEAIKAFDMATEISPEAVGPYQYRGELYGNLGDTDKAIEQLSKAIELAPANLASPLIRAELYSATEQYELALQDVESVLRRQPGLVRAHLMRTILLGRLGRSEEAISILKKIVEAAPDQPEIHLQLAGFYMDSGQSAEAVESLTRVIELAGDNAIAIRMRGDMYLAIGEHEKALADFAKAYEINPDDAGLLNNFAWTLATSPYDDLRDGKRAIELATRACELTEFKAAHILSTLAAAYAESGDFEKAIEFSQKAVAMHAEDKASQRDMSADLAAELSSYQSRRPWRELQNKDEQPPATEEEADQPVQPGAAPAMDF